MTNFEKQVIDLKSAIDVQENAVVSKMLTANTASSLTLFAPYGSCQCCCTGN